MPAVVPTVAPVVPAVPPVVPPAIVPAVAPAAVVPTVAPPGEALLGIDLEERLLAPIRPDDGRLVDDGRDGAADRIEPLVDRAGLLGFGRVRGGCLGVRRREADGEAQGSRRQQRCERTQRPTILGHPVLSPANSAAR